VPDRELPEAIASSLCRRVFGKIRLRRVAPVRHTISNRQITAFGFYGNVESQRSGARTDGFRWEHRSSLKTLLTSSLFFKAIGGTTDLFK